MVLRYGDGTDGNVTISSNTTLTGAKQYNNLTVNSGITLNTAGYQVKVKGTLTNNGIITDSSTGGAGGAYGAGGAGGTSWVGPENTTWYYANGVAGSAHTAGAGTGGDGGDGGGGGGSQNETSLSLQVIGGAGGRGGTGGKGGGTVLINAAIFTNNGTIHANGFVGSNAVNGGIGRYDHYGGGSGKIELDMASGGGGGGEGGHGGDGGTVTLYYGSRTTGTVTATGGSGGTAGTGGSGKNCSYVTGGVEMDGAGGSAGGTGAGAGGRGETQDGASGSGGNGTTTAGSAGSATWTQEDAPATDNAIFFGTAA